MAVVYPVAPTTVTLANASVGSIMRDYRDSGYTQGTSIVRDINPVKQSVDIDVVRRKFDFKTAKFVDASLAAATPATTDTVQLIPVDASTSILGGSLRVIRAASAGGSATATVKVGATAISAAIDLLTTGTTVVATATPLMVSANDTVDLLLTGTTSPVFDALVELVLNTQPNRG